MRRKPLSCWQGPARCIALALAALICAVPTVQATCPAADAASLAVVQLKAQGAGGDLLLADGRLLRLAGLPPPANEAASERRAAALALWTGRDLRLLLASPEPDRWGRLVGDLALPDTGSNPILTLALDLTARGLALPDPARVLPGCREAFALAEKQAKTASVTTVGTIDPLDLDTAKAHAGQFAAFEGQLVSVGERQRVTYLNFAWHRTKGASVVVPARLWRDMQQRGWTAESLPRKRVRARGLIVFRDGPSLTLTSLSHFEVLD